MNCQSLFRTSTLINSYVTAINTPMQTSIPKFRNSCDRKLTIAGIETIIA